jgi:beta-glucosidase-like glycosyl hydrolase
VAFIMTAHVLVPSLDEDGRDTVAADRQDTARRSSGYQGVILSDDLEMTAIAEAYAVREAAVQRLSRAVMAC